MPGKEAKLKSESWVQSELEAKHHSLTVGSPESTDDDTEDAFIFHNDIKLRNQRNKSKPVLHAHVQFSFRPPVMQPPVRHFVQGASPETQFDIDP